MIFKGFVLFQIPFVYNARQVQFCENVSNVSLQTGEHFATHNLSLEILSGHFVCVHNFRDFRENQKVLCHFSSDGLWCVQAGAVHVPEGVLSLLQDLRATPPWHLGHGSLRHLQLPVTRGETGQSNIHSAKRLRKSHFRETLNSAKMAFYFAK